MTWDNFCFDIQANHYLNGRQRWSHSRKARDTRCLPAEMQMTTVLLRWGASGRPYLYVKILVSLWGSISVEIFVDYLRMRDITSGKALHCVEMLARI